MAQEIKAKKYDVEVVFDPEKIASDPFSYVVDGVEGEDFTLVVDVPLAWVELTLRQGPGASFTTTPIQWIFNQSPIPTPPQFSVQRRDELAITILNINEAGQEPQEFHFEVAVMYQGKTYTSPDPTIVNTEPPHLLVEPVAAERPSLAA